MFYSFREDLVNSQAWYINFILQFFDECKVIRFISNLISNFLDNIPIQFSHNVSFLEHYKNIIS